VTTPTMLDGIPVTAPTLTAINGRMVWLCPDGRLLPHVRGGDTDTDDKTFTQADVDRIVQERLARVKTEPPADYEALKAAKKELDDLKAKDQTELQAALAKIETLTVERDKVVAERDGAAGAVKELQLRNAVVAAAAKAKAVDPDDIWALLPKDAVTIGDDGQVTGAENAVKALLEAKPHLVGKTTVPRPDPAQGQRGDAKDYGSAGKAEAQRRFGTADQQQK